MDQAYAGDKGTDDFRLFLGYYNRLESLINRYAVEISGDDYDYKYQRKQLPIFQALDILMSHQIFDEYAYIKIDEFRRYRNALVHSTNPESVNSRIYDELKKCMSYWKVPTLHQKPINKDVFYHLRSIVSSIF